MNPRRAAEEGVERRPARDLNADRNVGRKVVGAASAASTSGKVTEQGRGLIEQMIDSENLNLAWKKVAKNKGAAGVDGLDLEATMKTLRANRQRIEAELLAGTYVPQPVRRVEIPKASGGTRLLRVSTVQDRWIQQAILQVIGPLFETNFSAHSPSTPLWALSLSNGLRVPARTQCASGGTRRARVSTAREAVGGGPRPRQLL